MLAQYIIKDLENVKMVPTRNGFGMGLLELGERDERIVALCADLTESTRIDGFLKKFPERYIQVGIAEQNMIGIAAGLALAGKIPFAASYAVFSPGRSWDQVRVSVCYSQANVKIVGAHAGLSVGPDGATHQALEDIAIMRVLPHMTVIVPCDAIEAEKATIALGEHVGPAYIRLTRSDSAVITMGEMPFEIGKAYVCREGIDVSVIASGPVLYDVLRVAEELKKEKNISVEVINNHTIKPLDVNTIVTSAQKTNAVVTVEEHQIHGGAGSAVMEALALNYPVPVEQVGVGDVFGESGTPLELHQKYGISEPAIKKAIERVLLRK